MTDPAHPVAPRPGHQDVGEALDRPVDLRGGAVAIAGRPVLRGIDLTVESGEFVALMGPNGSGKSTLVRSLTGLWPLTRGELRLFGDPFERFRDWHRVGFVPQRSSAASGVPASVREVVSAGRLSRRRLLRPLRAADRAAVDEALALVGLADRARDGVSQLSGGQQQRVLIARALAGAADLYLLDEPTAGVDRANQTALAEALRSLKERGATVVLVAHELGVLAPLVDRSVVMRDGRVAYDGPPLGDHGLDRLPGGPGHPDAPPHRHDHHPHHPVRPHPDHTVHVAGPLDATRDHR